MTTKPLAALSKPTEQPQSPIAYAYERVSTAAQTADMQRSTNADYANRAGLLIGSIGNDTASGSTPWRDRAIANAVAEGSPYRHVIVYELSRIGRDLIDTLEFIRAAIDRDLTVHISRTGMRLGAGLDGKIMATVLGLVAEIEREFIRTRTRDALAERRRLIAENGSFTSATGAIRNALGRPKGATSASKLAPHAATIDPLLDHGATDQLIANLHGVSRATVRLYRQKRAKQTSQG